MNAARRSSFARRRGIHSKKVAILLLVVVVTVLARFWREHNRPTVPDALAEGTYTLRRVVDGDTLLLDNGARIRLLCADTPETVKRGHPVEPFGPEATQFTKDFLAAGRVHLTFDRQRVDRYNRFLAYAWRDERMDLMLNEELIRVGLAEAKTGYRFSQRMKKLFRRAEDEAKAARRGIWSGENPAEAEVQGRR